MPDLIGSPTRLETPGNVPKIVEEYFGFINTDDTKLSVAYVTSPPGWIGPGQRSDFDEFTVVLKGTLQVAHRGGQIEVNAGQAIHAHRHEWIQYSTPDASGAEYFAVCIPAFTRATVHRDL